ncbi:uncharacterized protein [Arachis hypogaea]|uniref:uncharacterized protein n=1 Tax=Arachis hypogaea TaxID=3818 RepID=UPI000DECDDE9|nr:uncharacterized protein LOC112803607 [Arachis hypogaea]
MIDEGSLSDFPYSSRPPLATAGFDLHCRFLFNGIDSSKPHTPQISDLEVFFRISNLITPQPTSPSRCRAHCHHRLLLLTAATQILSFHSIAIASTSSIACCLALTVGCDNDAHEISNVLLILVSQESRNQLLNFHGSTQIYQSKRGTKIYFAAAAANSSQDKLIAATNSSRDKSAASNTSQVKSVAATNSSRDTLAAAANFSRHKLTTGANFSRDKLTAAANSSRDKSAASNSSRDKLVAVASSSRDKSATSNSSEPSSVAPTISNHPSEPKHKRGRESNHYWTVDAIEEYEDSTRLHLLVRNVHNLPEGLRIVVNFDKQHAVIGEAAGLLAGVCGQLATNCVAFPISFDKLSDIPKSFFENQWKILSLARFCFKLSDSLAKQFLLQSLGEKWREYRIKLWNEFYDPRLSKTEIINNTLEDIAP